MTERKRKTGESFKAYREDLKADAKWLKGRLLGRWFYQHKINPKTGKMIPYRRAA